MNEQAQQLLQQMRPLHLPEQIGWWPLAPAWYVLFVSILLCLALLVFFALTHKRNSLFKKQALAELAFIEQQFNENPGHTNQSLQALSLLLKQVALTLLPRQSVSALHGEAWLEQLDKLDGSHFFTREQGQVLGNRLYQPNHEVNQHDVVLLIQRSKQLIQKLKKPATRRFFSWGKTP